MSERVISVCSAVDLSGSGTRLGYRVTLNQRRVTRLAHQMSDERSPSDRIVIGEKVLLFTMPRICDESDIRRGDDTGSFWIPSTNTLGRIYRSAQLSMTPVKHTPYFFSNLISENLLFCSVQCRHFAALSRV